MVGGLIQQKEFRRLRRGEGSGESGAQAFTARQCASRLQGVVTPERETGKLGAGVIVVEAGCEGFHVVDQRMQGIEPGDMLVEQGDARCVKRDIARDSFEIARYELQQGRLARAIRPGNGDTFRTANFKRQRTEQGLLPKAHDNICQTDETARGGQVTGWQVNRKRGDDLQPRLRL